MRHLRTLACLTLLLLLLAPMRAHAQEGRPQPEPTREPAPATNQVAVQLADGADPDAVAAQIGAVNLGQIGTLDYYVFEYPDDQPTTMLADARANPSVSSAEPVTIQPVATMDPSDPTFPDQWHLRNTGQGDAVAGNDANIVPAWDAGFTGEGVDIGIVEDNFQVDHPDLAPNYEAGRSLFGPLLNDEHATSAAGVAAAAADGTNCGVGAAYDADLATITWATTISGQPAVTNASIAQAWSHVTNVTDVYNNSWGYIEPAQPLPSLIEAALIDGVTNGRGGLGVIYVAAAGNGRTEKLWEPNPSFPNPYDEDDTNDSSMAASRYIITVAASSADGDYSGYSSPGASILINAPSNGGSGGGYTGVRTTDITGGGGYESGDCNSDYGGTSSATPLVSGVIALMLEANPNLTWRDVQHILVETAVQTDLGYGGWVTNGAGYTVSHDYGHGRVDAEAAVTMAQTWDNVRPEITLAYGRNVNQPIPDGGLKGTPGTPVTSTITVPEDIDLEHVEVVINATHPSRGDLEFKLTSPDGTESTMLRFRDFDFDADYNGWRLNSTHFWGEGSAGTWTLEVTDNWDEITGTLNSWQLVLYGTQTFIDVPSDNQPPSFEQWIEAFAEAGITEGCAENPPRFCPEDPVTRGAMAVFILRALAYPNDHTPTGDPAQIFADVPSPNQPPSFELWIEDFYKLGITTGCGASPLIYCPDAPVTRGAMAVFILRALEGAGYMPQGAQGQVFADVPSPNQPPSFELWIEDFYTRGITTGCAENPLRFCPDDPVTRGAMALFILRAFEDIPSPDNP